MVRVAARVPITVGSKRTWKAVVVLETTGVVGKLTRLKSPDAGPVIETTGEPVRFKDSIPLLEMVKVRVIASPRVILPKSVWSAEEGVVSPAAISAALPKTAISGAGTFRKM